MENHIACIREGKEDSRVHGALMYAFALAGGCMAECCGVEKLEDHKGELNVQWSSKYNHNLYSNYINRAWLEFANEPNVSHYILSNNEEFHLSGVNLFNRKIIS